MAAEIVVHGFETSNNMKVRVALGYKDLPYEFRAIDPADRSEIVRISGQHLTPVLVHGERVLFDSAAILRYLDANFRDGPRLFGESRDEQWAIEELELFARTELAGPMMRLVHYRVSGGGELDEAMRAGCAGDFAKAARRLIDDLDGREWLVGDEMTAADITAAAVMYRIRVARLFDPPEGVQAIDGWIDRVMAYDRFISGTGYETRGNERIRPPARCAAPYCRILSFPRVSYPVPETSHSFIPSSFVSCPRNQGLQGGGSIAVTPCSSSHAFMRSRRHSAR